jgi:hypothetical protein
MKARHAAMRGKNIKLDHCPLDDDEWPKKTVVSLSEMMSIEENISNTVHNLQGHTRT